VNCKNMAAVGLFSGLQPVSTIASGSQHLHHITTESFITGRAILLSVKLGTGNSSKGSGSRGVGEQQIPQPAGIASPGRGTGQQTTRPFQTSAVHDQQSGAVQWLIELSGEDTVASND
jgi:hypothetical protein